MEFETASQAGFEDTLASAEALYTSGPARTRKIRVHGNENAPLIPAGSRAFVVYVAPEQVDLGKFVLVKTDRGPAFRRLVRKRKGADGKPVLYCRALNSKSPPKPTMADDYLGMVDEVEYGGRRVNPAAEGWLQAFLNRMTDYGTTNPVSKLINALSGR